jgi:hypothetical protein
MNNDKKKGIKVTEQISMKSKHRKRGRKPAIEHHILLYSKKRSIGS